MEMTVFIADDSAILQERLTMLLSGIDNVEIVGRAYTVEDAFELLEDLRPDVLILDIRMPGGNGMDILKRVRADVIYRPVIIVFTNYPYPQYKRCCMDLDADYFFNKSSDFEKLLETVSNLEASSRNTNGTTG